MVIWRGKERKVGQESLFVRVSHGSIYAGASEGSPICVEGQSGRDKVRALRGVAQGENRGVLGEDNPFGGPIRVTANMLRKAHREEGAGFCGGEGRKLGFLEASYCWHGVDERGQNIVTFVILAEATGVPGEQRNRFMHKAEEAPTESTNWTPLTAQMQ